MKKFLVLILIALLLSSCSVVAWLNRPDDVHEAIEKQGTVPIIKNF